MRVTDNAPVVETDKECAAFVGMEGYCWRPSFRTVGMMCNPHITLQPCHRIAMHDNFSTAFLNAVL